MVTNQLQACMHRPEPVAGPEPRFYLQANHMYIRNGLLDHMSVTIKMDRVDDRLCRLLGLGSLSSSSASLGSSLVSLLGCQILV